MSYLEFFIQSEYIFRIIVAGICGCIIGYERKNRNKEAGVRTHAIVAVGAALIMVVSKYGFEDSIRFDASRVASQIVSGVGFLGAGIIFVRKRMVSGLTTAAGIWTTCGIGMAIGSGLYYIGIISSFVVVLIQILMHKEIFNNKEIEREIIQLRIKEDVSIQSVREIFKENNIKLLCMDFQKLQPNDMSITAEITLNQGQSLLEFVTLLSEDSRVVATKRIRE